jgi:protein-tyrosine-phosphatase
VEIPVSLHLILSQYWPGNLTVIIPVNNLMFDNVAFNGKVAFRVPHDKLLRDIIEKLGEPIISTSINLSGIQPATSIEDIQKRYSSWFDFGIIPRNTHIPEPSTIVEYIDTDSEGKPVLPHLKCIRESSIPFYQIKQNFTKPIVLFICMGNICRSPIAEYLFNCYSRGNNLPFIAKSAGLMDSGNIISLNSQQLLAERNIMSSEHTSRKVNPEILSDSWLVLAMEEYHRNYIKANFPETSHKVFTLREFIGEKGDIEDPYGSSLENYRITYNQIDEALIKLIELLEKQLIL